MDPISLEKALEVRGNDRWWLLWIFLLVSSPGIFNSMHLTSYVFLGGNPTFWCDVPQLRQAGWTDEQIKNITSPWLDSSSCKKYDWNYTYLAGIGFEAAHDYVRNVNQTHFVKCDSYIYDEDSPHQTIVSEWDLVCENLPLRSTVQVAVAFGKFVGAFFFGLFADRFGRKKIFGLCCLMYIAVGPVTAFITDYYVFLLLRILIGIAGSGVYEAGFTILSELTVKNVRAYLGCMYNLSYSVGFILLPLAAYLSPDWKTLQLAISVPTLLLLIHCWCLPESPRWLITRGKIEKASLVLGQSLDTQHLSFIDNHKTDTCHRKFLDFWNCFLRMFSTPELRKRTIICYFSWFVAQLYYFAVALNGANFHVNQYIYVGMNGLFEVPGYLLPLLVLRYFGRRSAASALYLFSGVALLVVVCLPEGWPVMTVAMLGRMSISAVYAVIILLTSELFPTELRNTAIGSSLTMAQIGSMAAPYLVDILGGQVAWFLPSTVCGGFALLNAVIVLFLPETRDTPMTDTVQELEAQLAQGKSSSNK